ARMPRRHHAMIDELARPRAAEMAIEADARAHLRPIERGHAVHDIGGMRRADRIMRGEPAARRAVAALAPDAVLREEARAARAGRGGMAPETGGRGSRLAQPERRRDLPPARPAEHRKGTAMRPARCRGLL